MSSSEQTILSLPQRAYLIAGGLRESNKAVFIVYAAVVGYLSLWLFVSFYYKDPTTLQIMVPYTIIAFSIFMVWYYNRARDVYHELKQWQESYLDQAYIINFDTTIPQGNTIAERVLNLAKTVFPELTSDYTHFSPYFSDHIKWHFRKKLFGTENKKLSQVMDYTIDQYTLDLVLRTTKGYFIVKYFKYELVGLEDIRQLAEVIRGKFRDKYQRTFVFRVICVAKRYDNSFLQQKEKQMTENLKANFNIDLLVEEKVGYSVLWIDRK